MRVILAVIGLSLVLTGAANAQERTYTSQETTQYGRQLIASAGAQDLFVLEGVAPPAAFIRHSASGMRCVLAIGYNSEITVLRTDRRGDDVTCSESTDGFSVTTRATRYPDRPDLVTALQRATDTLLQEHPEARSLDVSTLPTMPGQSGSTPLSQSLAYLVTIDGEQRFVRISMYAAGDWIYALHLEAPASDYNAIADYTWRNLLNDLQNHLPGGRSR